MTLVTPKFLTPELAAVAVELAYRSVFQTMRGSIKMESERIHIALVVPAREADTPNGCFTPFLLYERGFGGRSTEESPIREIACSKALQLWRGQQNGGTDIEPQHLFVGDTRHWGGVMRGLIACGGSGQDPHKDRLVASITVDVLIALAYDAWLNSTEKTERLPFIT